MPTDSKRIAEQAGGADDKGLIYAQLETAAQIERIANALEAMPEILALVKKELVRDSEPEMPACPACGDPNCVYQLDNARHLKAWSDARARGEST